MKKANKAFWRQTTINGHAGAYLVMNFEGDHGYYVLAQVWPADEKGRYWVSVFHEDAFAAAASKRQAQAWARRRLERLREKLEAL